MRDGDSAPFLNGLRLWWILMPWRTRTLLWTRNRATAVLSCEWMDTLYVVHSTIVQSRDLKASVQMCEQRENVTAACMHALHVVETDPHGSNVSSTSKTSMNLMFFL